MRRTDSQTLASMRSCFRYLPGSQDEGQRYAVTYRDGLGTKRYYGFTDDTEEAARLLAAVRADSRWRGARIRDRRPA